MGNHLYHVKGRWVGCSRESKHNLYCAHDYGGGYGHGFYDNLWYSLSGTILYCFGCRSDGEPSGDCTNRV